MLVAEAGRPAGTVADDAAVEGEGRMGLRDALKSLRGGTTSGALEDISAEAAPEPDWFRPRFDGVYRASSDAAAAGGAADPHIALRFLPSGRVFEHSGTSATAGPADPADRSGTGTEAGPAAPRADDNPCQGEYTAAGRFNVQRRFERIISYAVLEMEPEGFTARRINAADRSTTQLSFGFVPDAAAQRD